jgi:hypothetical protein
MRRKAKLSTVNKRNRASISSYQKFKVKLVVKGSNDSIALVFALIIGLLDIECQKGHGFGI